MLNLNLMCPCVCVCLYIYYYILWEIASSLVHFFFSLIFQTYTDTRIQTHTILYILDYGVPISPHINTLNTMCCAVLSEQKKHEATTVNETYRNSVHFRSNLCSKSALFIRRRPPLHFHNFLHCVTFM